MKYKKNRNKFKKKLCRNYLETFIKFERKKKIEESWEKLLFNLSCYFIWIMWKYQEKEECKKEIQIFLSNLSFNFQRKIKYNKNGFKMYKFFKFFLL